MRIALLQLRVSRRGRSANLAHVLGRVIAAAEAVPAPDLLVLPACCDGVDGGEVTEAMAQGFGESLAAAAREWGVFLAAGALRAVDGKVCEQGRLYDPDGDVIAWGPGSAESGPGPTFDTVLGRVSIGLGIEDRLVGLPEGDCDLLLIHGRWRAPVEEVQQVCGRLREDLARAARRAGGAVCAAGVVCEPDEDGREFMGGSAMFQANEECVVAAQLGNEETVMGQVTLDPTPARAK
jgi:predicted amidohydrolase